MGLPFLDPSNEFVGPLDWLRIVGPLDELTSDAGDGVSGGGVPDLSDGATTIVEVRGNFGETPTFASRIFGVGNGDDGGDDAGGLCGAERSAIHRQVECHANVGDVELELDRGSIREGVHADLAGIGVVPSEEPVDQLGEDTPRANPREEL